MVKAKPARKRVNAFPLAAFKTVSDVLLKLTESVRSTIKIGSREV